MTDTEIIQEDQKIIIESSRETLGRKGDVIRTVHTKITVEGDLADVLGSVFGPHTLSNINAAIGDQITKDD